MPNSSTGDKGAPYTHSREIPKIALRQNLELKVSPCRPVIQDIPAGGVTGHGLTNGSSGSVIAKFPQV